MHLPEVSTIRLEIIQEHLDSGCTVCHPKIRCCDAWVQALLVQLHYERLSRQNKGLVRAYIQHITGHARSQTERYIRAYHHSLQAQPAQKETTLDASPATDIPAPVAVLNCAPSAIIDESRAVPAFSQTDAVCRCAWCRFKQLPWLHILRHVTVVSILVNIALVGILLMHVLRDEAGQTIPASIIEQTTSPDPLPDGR